MSTNVTSQETKYHRVVFLKDGHPTSVVFPGYVLAHKFFSTLHSSRKAKIVPAPELENVDVAPAASDRPAGTIMYCPKGPRLRTWLPRKPRLMRRYPDFSKNVMNLPTQSAGFSLTFPEQPATAVTVVARHSSLQEASEWTKKRFGEMGNGEWWG